MWIVVDIALDEKMVERADPPTGAPCAGSEHDSHGARAGGNGICAAGDGSVSGASARSRGMGLGRVRAVVRGVYVGVRRLWIRPFRHARGSASPRRPRET